MATGPKQAARLERSTPRATLKAGVRYDERAKMYIGYAPSLNIYSQARTEAHARRALESAITLFLTAASNGRGFAAILATAGLIKPHRKNGSNHEGNRIHAIEEEILAQQNFDWIFDVPACVPQEGRAT